MSAQLAFAALLTEADNHRHAALDRHRERVQTWFDELEIADKEQLAEWFAMFEWDTCVALSAAAGDYRSAHVANGK